MVRIAGPDRYQIDHADAPPHDPKTIACDGRHRWQVYASKVTIGPASPPPGDIADLADTSWLLACRLSGDTPVTVGGRSTYRIGVDRGDAERSLTLMFSTAVAIVDAELGIMLRLTSYLGGKPVRRYELRDITVGAGDFRVDFPADLPTVEETGPSSEAGPAGLGLPLAVAGVVARQVGTETAKAARNILRRINTR